MNEILKWAIFNWFEIGAWVAVVAVVFLIFWRSA